MTPLPQFCVSRRLCPVEPWLWLCRRLHVESHQYPFIYLIAGSELYYGLLERLVSYPDQWPPVPKNPITL